MEPRPGELELGEEQTETESQPIAEDFGFSEPEPQKPDLSKARSLLTEPHPAGFGEVLVTDVWMAPAPKEKKEKAVDAPESIQDKSLELIQKKLAGLAQVVSPDVQPEGSFESAQEKPPDRQQEWDTRQELRQLGLLRERALVSYDARFEQYWQQVKEAIAAAPNAIVDPYTEFAAEFADARIDEIRDDRRIAREYGREGDALLKLGRAYFAIGRYKGARAVLESAAKAEPQEPEIWYNLGLARLFGRAHATARQALENALDQAPGDFRAELALAVACYHLKDYAAAEEHFRRLAGSSGLRATARAMLACSHRMQGHWDDARIELHFLKGAKPGDWPALAQQCLDCVERGEQKREGLLRAKRRSGQMWRALAATAGGGVWLAYSLAENLFREKAQWAVVPLFGLALLLVRSLKGFSGKELPGEFGNAEQGLPCWQANTWMKPKQSEF